MHDSWLTLAASFPFSLILVSISIFESSIIFVSSGDGSLSTFATLRLVLRDRDTDLDRDRERLDLDGILVLIRLETTSTKAMNRYQNPYIRTEYFHKGVTPTYLHHSCITLVAGSVLIIIDLITISSNIPFNSSFFPLLDRLVIKYNRIAVFSYWHFLKKVKYYGLV